MQEMKCPDCGEVFAVDESGYVQIVQVRWNKKGRMKSAVIT